MPVPERVTLEPAALEAFGRELDAIQLEVRASLGAADRAYIPLLITIQRTLAASGRGLMLASVPLMPAVPLFIGVLGTGAAALAVAKILENMELGHNILHGQWDWMNDPEIHSSSWEWDHACPADQWKHSHNVMHHTWTNVLGRDRDVGYDILRVSSLQRWHPAHLGQPVYALALAMLFEWGIALHDLDLGALRRRETTLAKLGGKLAGIGRKARRQLLKDYVLWPLLAGPGFVPVLVANALANLARNLWTYAIIFCGHFPDGAQVFTEAQVAGETRGGWYLRQILGSCNIDGGPLFHVMSGNLSHQIEHHLFPDLPSNRYPQIAPRVEALCARYGIPYNRGSFARQLGTTLRTICRLALPARARPLPA